MKFYEKTYKVLCPIDEDVIDAMRDCYDVEEDEELEISNKIIMEYFEGLMLDDILDFSDSTFSEIKAKIVEKD